MLNRIPFFKTKVGDDSHSESALNTVLPITDGSIILGNTAANGNAVLRFEPLDPQKILQTDRNIDTLFVNNTRVKDNSASDELKIDLLKILAHW